MFEYIKCKLGSSISNLILPNGLYCFNYHRIGDPTQTEYDPNVFSCDVDNFAEHIQYINNNFTVINLEDLDIIISDKIRDKRYALVTFDDGYIDNYTKAFPILVKNSVPATFFLATNFINSSQIPWWDKIANFTRNAQVSDVKLDNWPDSVDICKDNISRSIRSILERVKVNNGPSIDDVLIELEQKLKVSKIESSETEPLFMSWDMAREMKNSGMEFGSQTCSHRIMSHLSLDEQDYEAKTSKNILEKELDIKISAFAYPVGGSDSFTSDTIDVVQKYYNYSFSFISGINTSEKLNKYTIERVSVDSNATATQLSYNLLKVMVKKS